MPAGGEGLREYLLDGNRNASCKDGALEAQIQLHRRPRDRIIGDLYIDLIDTNHLLRRRASEKDRTGKQEYGHGAGGISGVRARRGPVEGRLHRIPQIRERRPNDASVSQITVIWPHSRPEQRDHRIAKGWIPRRV